MHHLWQSLKICISFKFRYSQFNCIYTVNALEPNTFAYTHNKLDNKYILFIELKLSKTKSTTEVPETRPCNWVLCYHPCGRPIFHGVGCAFPHRQQMAAEQATWRPLCLYVYVLLNNATRHQTTNESVIYANRELYLCSFLVSMELDTEQICCIVVSKVKITNWLSSIILIPYEDAWIWKIDLNKL